MGLRERITDVADQPVPGHVDLVADYRRKLLAEVDLAELSTFSAPQRRARLERVLSRTLSREGPVLSTYERSRLIRRVVDEALGLGVLEPLLEDPTITEIMVNGPDVIFVERSGRLERVEARFPSVDQLYQTIDRIVSAVNRRVDESSPMVDARLPTGERVNVIVPPLSLSGPAMTIRRFPRPYSIDELVALGAIDVPLAGLLAAFVRARLNIIVSGGTGSGKTTMLNALSAFIPARERIVTIEDAAELSLQQEHVIRLESRPPNIEGRGQVTIRDLMRNSLRMRPDRIIVGEVRGGETLDMLQAMSTGHEGSLATVHANSAEDAVMRLETLASMSELQIPFEALRDQINSAVDAIVFLARGSDGVRRITEVAAVTSARREAFQLTTLADFDQEPVGPDRTVQGHFRHLPLPAALAERLLRAGERVPPGFPSLPGEHRSFPRREPR
ncbi:CpaF family protein [Kitasatospora sp. NPDC059571]|uniref:CpaF family protein n=1 Tax=Kitasatospora sp. NPDC059571 TaxID=3346871 RepID=UPI003686BDFC